MRTEVQQQRAALLGLAAEKLREGEEAQAIAADLENRVVTADWCDELGEDLARSVRHHADALASLARRLADSILDGDQDTIRRTLDDLQNRDTEMRDRLDQISARIDFETSIAATGRICTKLGILTRQRICPPDLLAYVAQVRSEGDAAVEQYEAGGELDHDDLDMLIERLGSAVDAVCDCPVRERGDR